MKLFFCLIILILFTNCSFDKKTGIWKNENILSDQKKIIKDGFIKINDASNLNKEFKKVIFLDKNFKFNLFKPISVFEWTDFYYSQTNNLENFKYDNLGTLSLKSKKLSRSKVSNFILYSNNEIIFSDEKGNIIFFSPSEKTKPKKFNFYKKKYKNFKKELNIAINNKTLFISDNLGYLYSYDQVSRRVLWAKNTKIPFRSNLKIKGDRIYTSNQNNDLLIFNKNTGDIIKQIPTERAIIKNSFKNIIVLDEKKTIFFLNSYGSLYSIDSEFLEIKWFINLNQNLDFNPSNLFLSNQIIYNQKKIIISTNYSTYFIDTEIGSIIYKNNFTTKLRPIINNNYLFLVTKNNFLVSIDLIEKKVLFSRDIDNAVSQFLNINKKKAQLKSLMLVNNNLYVLLKNSYLLIFNINGELKKIERLKNKVYSDPIIIDSSLIYLDNKNRIVVQN